MAAGTNEDVRGHLRTQAVCATQNVEQAGEMETKKEWERNVFHCVSMRCSEELLTHRESAVTLHDPRLLNKTNLNLSEENKMS